MKKRVLSILPCLCMAVTLLPTAALAVDNYGVTVSGVQVTSENKDEITGHGITRTVTYDPDTKTLTLNSATIVNASPIYDGDYGILFTTHDPNHAFALKSSTWFLNDGYILAQGDAQEVLTKELLQATYGQRVSLYEFNKTKVCSISKL